MVKKHTKLTDLPGGFYHEIFNQGNSIRRAWHYQKFQRVIDCLPTRAGQDILDIGCFAGTFLSLLPSETFKRQLGVDILANQIEFAQSHFKTNYREFMHIPSVAQISRVSDTFDCITLIEVIEHLEKSEIAELVTQLTEKLKPHGRLVISTPNYLSTWPLLEFLINRFADVSYEEQHITRFNYLNCVKKLESIAPELRSQFKLEFRTTTHFISPFVAGISFGLSNLLSRSINHNRWKFPFGNLILMIFTKNG